MKELKPCPFCGGEVSMTYNSASRTFNIWHTDRKCELAEPIMIDQSGAVRSMAEATKVWNRRVKE